MRRWAFTFPGGRVELVVDGASASYTAVVARDSGGVVAVVDPEMAAPRVGLELRAPGLWADHIEEGPGHWTVRNEAHAVALDSEDEIAPDARGVATPVAIDLDIEDVGERVEIEGGYEIECRVCGEVLVGHDELVVDGIGRRSYTELPR